jgi:membrane-associated phospholipid phosphatase
VDGLSELLRQVGEWDQTALELSHLARWQPLTIVFVLASAWWVKWPVFAAVGVGCDAAKRRSVPVAAACAAVAAGLAEAFAVGVKQLTERPRPPLTDPALNALIAIPHSTSFPSGHAATAFAAAVAVAVLHPRLRLPLFGLAVLVALSRVYLGVHYWSDVFVGSLVGAGIGLMTACLARRIAEARRARVPSL